MAITRRWKQRRSAGEAQHDEVDGASEPDAPTPVATLVETAPDDPKPDDVRDDPTTDDPTPRGGLRDFGPWVMFLAAHPKQALLTALGVATVAALANRPMREVGAVFATVLVGQAILGWHNDLVDRRRDLAHDTPGKPIAQGRLDPGNVWFVLACAVLLVVPLAISTGITAGSCYLISIAIGLLGNVALRAGFLSWAPWAASYALYPAYVSYGGWGGLAEGNPPTVLMTVLAALLGVGVHFLRALWGLVPDNEDGWTYLPLKVGMKIGATKLLVVSTTYVALVLVAMAYAGSTVGLAQR